MDNTWSDRSVMVGTGSSCVDIEMLTESQPEPLDAGIPSTEPIANTVITKKRKTPKKTSVVWNQFNQVTVKNDDGTPMKKTDGTDMMKAMCKICNELLVYGGTNGTSHLRRHMDSCVRRSTADAQQTIIGRTPTGGVYTFTFNQRVARNETVRYFVREEISFLKVDNPAFHRWIKRAFGPQFKPPCRKTMRDYVVKTFQEERSVLKDELNKLPGKICLTSDMWTSNQRLGYMCITAHYISNDWKLNKRIISFPVLPSPHTGKAISEAVYANLLGWNICEKVGSLTLDNASNNDNAVSRLKESLFGEEMLSKEMFHVRCNAHIINLLVKEGLEYVESSLEIIRESVKHVKSSQAKLQSFYEDCASLKLKGRRLPLDVPTRWNSTYLMLLEVIPYQKVFDLFFCGSDQSAPNDEDWKNAIVIRDFLKIFYDSTRLFSGTKYVTSSAFCYQLNKMSLLLKKYANVPNFKELCASMKAKYDKYWKDIPVVLGLASVMDPRYKLTILELCLDLNNDSYPQPQSFPQPHTRTRAQCQSHLEHVPSGSELNMPIYKSKLEELFDVYQCKLTCNVQDQSNPPSNLVEEDDMVMAMLSKWREASIATCKSDLQRYLDQPTLVVLNGEPFNVLDWWRAQEATYPVLAAMARDLLTIQVSTVASESAFSASGRVLSKYRSCLLPETVEALICLKDWFQAEEGLQDEALKDLEEMMTGLEL